MQVTFCRPSRDCKVLAAIKYSRGRACAGPRARPSRRAGEVWPYAQHQTTVVVISVRRSEFYHAEGPDGRDGKISTFFAIHLVHFQIGI